MDRLNKYIHKISGIFHRGEGHQFHGRPHPDPNTLKHKRKWDMVGVTDKENLHSRFFVDGFS